MAPTHPSPEVADAERELAAAHLTLDVAVLERLLHPDYVIVQPDGKTEGKADVVASFQSGERHWDLAEVDQLEVRLVDRTAVVIGRWRARGRNGNAVFDYAARFLSIWVNADGRWQNLAYQSTGIPPSLPSTGLE